MRIEFDTRILKNSSNEVVVNIMCGEYVVKSYRSRNYMSDSEAAMWAVQCFAADVSTLLGDV